MVEAANLTAFMTTKYNNKILLEKDINIDFITSFLQNDAKNVYLNIHLPPSYRGLSSWSAEVGFLLESKKQINAVKALFGGIRLDIFDLDSKTAEEKTEFYLSDACPEFGMNIDFCDGSFMCIYIKDELKDILGANLTVQYNKFNENKTHKCFTALVCDEVKNSIIDLANNMFDEYVKKRL